MARIKPIHLIATNTQLKYSDKTFPQNLNSRSMYLNLREIGRLRLASLWDIHSLLLVKPSGGKFWCHGMWDGRQMRLLMWQSLV